MIISDKLITNAYRCVGVLLFFLFSCISFANESNELSKIQSKIKEHEYEISQKQKSLNELQKQLEKDQKEFDLLNEKLKNSEKHQKEITLHLRQLQKKQEELFQIKDKHFTILNTMIVNAYKLGSYDYIKIILNNKDPNVIGRMFEYYSYFLNARLKKIDEIDKLTLEITDNKNKIESNNKQLQALIKEHKTNVQKNKINLQKKEITANEINKKIKQEKQTLAKLKETEKDLFNKIKANQEIIEKQKKEAQKRRVAEAREVAKKNGFSEKEAEKKVIQEIEKNTLLGLDKVKGKLIWPTNGKVLKKFGDSRAGELKWKGLLIKSKNEQVRAIYDGDIILATFLEGYGNIIVIDHGNGYISLYGNNRDIIKKLGDHVKTGELISYIDPNYIQLDGALYFEIRYAGEPLNPTKWLKKDKL